MMGRDKKGGALNRGRTLGISITAYKRREYANMLDAVVGCFI